MEAVVSSVHRLLLYAVQTVAGGTLLRRTRERKEHISDYLNRLSGYARNARLQVEKGQHDAKDHVEQFLLTWDDDRLKQDLGRLHLNDVRELGEILVSLLKGEERLIARGATQQFRYEGDSYRRGDARSRSEGRFEQERSSRRERRDRRDYGSWDVATTTVASDASKTDSARILSVHHG
ncbi:hypothetical protein PC128_g8940 [Phytophthora cactorum]|nr:hypothetical protein PC120_g19607 [Phytophthora cactorum]KAG3048496.1 hypothetical protein PC121_g19448 [Phytophthora cactorum]KAG3194914.1 hypothetical protein PC128_g8940 [Phytophthora cactorum]KAG4044440.1 hypothetical protein PC123_g20116 [Phytophthora cactorum]